jgi:mRNA-degrading endonuclease RelE of RelBE toxin-antitoxin system
MKHLARASFWESYQRLPERIRRLADKNFELLKQDERHASLQLKKVGKLWSVRVGRDYRALAFDSSVGLVWFWIGPHHEYDKILG